MIQVAKAAGQEPLEFKDHTLYLNWGMEDLLELNEIVSTTRTEIIPPQLNKPSRLTLLWFSWEPA